MVRHIAPLTAALVTALSVTTFSQSPPPLNPGTPPQARPVQPPPEPSTLPVPAPSTGTQTPPRQPAEAGNRDTTPTEASISGCVERESDFRAARDKTKAEPANAGTRNEYVLTRATTGGPVPTAGATAPGSPTYQITGAAEEKLGPFLGQRVELTGRLKATSAPTEAEAKESSALDLRRVEVTAVHAASGNCQ